MHCISPSPSLIILNIHKSNTLFHLEDCLKIEDISDGIGSCFSRTEPNRTEPRDFSKSLNRTEPNRKILNRNRTEPNRKILNRNRTEPNRMNLAFKTGKKYHSMLVFGLNCLGICRHQNLFKHFDLQFWISKFGIYIRCRFRL